MTWSGRSLRTQTAIVLVLSFVLLQIFSMAVSSTLVLAPILRQSANDLARLMTEAVETWQALPDNQRTEYARQLAAVNSILIEPDARETSDRKSWVPYVRILQDALSRELGMPVQLFKLEKDQTWFFADISVNGTDLRISFPRSRIGTQPPLTMALIFSLTLVVSLLVAFALARSITRPLARLEKATTVVARGRLPEPLDENGPEEIRQLARHFNTMAGEVKRLLDSRSTLLAGVSHDLRTPMARLRLNLELVSDQLDPGRQERMENDIERMDELLEQFLAVCRNSDGQDRARVSIKGLVEEVVLELDSSGKRLQLHSASDDCALDIAVLGLRRVLVNIMSNALKYSTQPVDIEMNCIDGKIEIAVLDRGPGIPDSYKDRVFEPFVRTDSAVATDPQGSGLGLAIVHQIAVSQDWDIQLSDRSGGGLCVRLILPGQVAASA